MKSWLKERLHIWLDAKPDWLATAAKVTISDDMVTDPAILSEI